MKIWKRLLGGLTACLLLSSGGQALAAGVQVYAPGTSSPSGTFDPSVTNALDIEISSRGYITGESDPLSLPASWAATGTSYRAHTADYLRNTGARYWMTWDDGVGILWQSTNSANVYVVGTGGIGYNGPAAGTVLIADEYAENYWVDGGSTWSLGRTADGDTFDWTLEDVAANGFVWEGTAPDLPYGFAPDPAESGAGALVLDWVQVTNSLAVLQSNDLTSVLSGYLTADWAATGCVSCATRLTSSGADYWMTVDSGTGILWRVADDTTRVYVASHNEVFSGPDVGSTYIGGPIAWLGDGPEDIFGFGDDHFSLLQGPKSWQSDVLYGYSMPATVFSVDLTEVAVVRYAPITNSYPLAAQADLAAALVLCAGNLAATSALDRAYADGLWTTGLTAYAEAEAAARAAGDAAGSNYTAAVVATSGAVWRAQWQYDAGVTGAVVLAAAQAAAGATGAVAVAIATNLVAQLTPILYYPDHLPKTRLALYRVRAAITNMTVDCIGDSTTDVTDGTRLKSWARKCSDALSSIANVPSSYDSWAGQSTRTTLAGIVAADSRMTLGEGWVSVAQSSYGGNILYVPSSSTNAMTFTPYKAWNVIEIEYLAASGNGTFAIVTNGAAMATVNANSSTSLRFETYTAATPSTQAVSIVHTGTGGVVFILSVRLSNSSEPRVLVTNAGWSSSTSSSWSTNYTLSHYGSLSRITKRKADLLVVSLGVNDWNGATTLETYTTNINIIVTTQLAAGGEVLLVGQLESDPASYATAKRQSEFRAVLLDIAATRPGVAFLDTRYKFGSYSEANASGYMADARHPNEAGATLWGNLVARNLLNLVTP